MRDYLPASLKIEKSDHIITISKHLIIQSNENTEKHLIYNRATPVNTAILTRLTT